MNPTLTLISAIGTIIASVTFATWVLSNKGSNDKAAVVAEVSKLRADVMAEVSKLRTDIAVMQKSEELRDEKINKMWSWWLTALERGWINHMKGLSD